MNFIDLRYRIYRKHEFLSSIQDNILGWSSLCYCCTFKKRFKFNAKIINTFCNCKQFSFCNNCISSIYSEFVEHWTEKISSSDSVIFRDFFGIMSNRYQYTKQYVYNHLLIYLVYLREIAMYVLFNQKHKHQLLELWKIPCWTRYKHVK